MQAPTRRGARPRRALRATVAVALLLVAGVAVVDTVAAARTEDRLADLVRPPTPGSPRPLVTLGGVPYLLTAARGEAPSLTVRTEDCSRPGLPGATIEARLSDVSAPGGWAAVEAGGIVHAGRVSVRVLVTGDVLGRALGLRGVTLSSGRDSSLAGGHERRARVTGTDAATGTPFEGEVDLESHNGLAVLVPAPGTGGGRLAHAFPHTVLPLGLGVSSVTVQAGTLELSGASGPRDVAPADLARCAVSS